MSAAPMPGGRESGLTSGRALKNCVLDLQGVLKDFQSMIKHRPNEKKHHAAENRSVVGETWFEKNQSAIVDKLCFDEMQLEASF